MTNLDPAVLNEWIHLELDGELAPAEQAKLRQALQDSPVAAADRAEYRQLMAMLEDAREPVESDFHSRVLESLPSAGWEARPVRNWVAMIGLFVALGGAAAALIGGSAAGFAPESAFGAALLAVVDLFRAGLVTGAGMLGATWKGSGLAVGQWLQLSWGSLAAFGIIVACLNVQLYRMVRRRRRLAPSIQRELERTSRSQD